MSPAKKKNGGARPGAGRKKQKLVPVVAAPIDGRTVEGKNHATYLIEQLNAIDPELMERKDLFVSPEPIEIPADVKDEVKKQLQKAELQRQELWKIKQAATKEFRKLSFELQGWAPLWFHERSALETRKYLHDKSEGKALQTLNHLHDKPQEHLVTISLGEGMRLAMQKAEQRVSGKRN